LQNQCKRNGAESKAVFSASFLKKLSCFSGAFLFIKTAPCKCMGPEKQNQNFAAVSVIIP
jgi:hypothetical protein